jgi:hypothetical protein
MRHPVSISRRSALQGLTGGGVAVAATTLGRHHAAAQSATPTSSDRHPLIGTWRISAAPPAPPLGLATYHADGTMVFLFPSPFPEADPGGPLGYQSPAYGVWEPTGERSAAVGTTTIGTAETVQIIRSRSSYTRCVCTFRDPCTCPKSAGRPVTCGCARELIGPRAIASTVRVAR